MKNGKSVTNQIIRWEERVVRGSKIQGYLFNGITKVNRVNPLQDDKNMLKKKTPCLYGLFKAKDVISLLGCCVCVKVHTFCTIYSRRNHK